MHAAFDAVSRHANAVSRTVERLGRRRAIGFFNGPSQRMGAHSAHSMSWLRLSRDPTRVLEVDAIFNTICNANFNAIQAGVTLI